MSLCACLSSGVHEGRMPSVRLESEARLGKAIRILKKTILRDKGHP